MPNQLFLNNVIKPLHNHFFSQARLNVLASEISALIPVSVMFGGIDIGCGAGELLTQLSLRRPEIEFTGVDVIERVPSNAKQNFQYQNYDGKHLPFSDNAFSFSMLVDVLHHADEPKWVLAEAARVSRDFIIIKDHVCNSRIDNFLLKTMDWVGNKPAGVNLPYYYFSNQEWHVLFHELKLEIEKKVEKLKLYNAFISIIFGPKLHFIAKLKVEKS